MGRYPGTDKYYDIQWIANPASPWQQGGWGYRLPVLTMDGIISSSWDTPLTYGEYGPTSWQYHQCDAATDFVFAGLDGVQHTLPIGILAADVQGDVNTGCHTATSPANAEGVLSSTSVPDGDFNGSGPVTVTDAAGSTSLTGPCTLAGSTVSYPAVSEIDLPDRQKYSFAYDNSSGQDPYGLLRKITYPGGGYVRYAWSLNLRSQANEFASVEVPFVNDSDTPGTAYTQECILTHDAPAVSDRYVSFDGVHEVLHQHFDYSTQWDSQNDGYWTSKTTTVTTTDLGSGQVTKTVYTYGWVATPNNIPYESDTRIHQVPVESEVEYEDGNGAVLRTVKENWANVREQTGRQMVLDNGQTSTELRCYNADEQVAEVDAYGFPRDGAAGTVPGCASTSGLQGVGPLERRTVTAWHDFMAASPATHITNEPDSVTVYDSSGATVQQSSDSYDGGTLQASGATIGLAPPPGVRGNLTAFARWVNTSNTWLTTNYAWDDAGQLVSRTDAGGHTTRYTWGDAAGAPSGTDSFLLQVQYPDTSSPNLAHHVESYTWDYASGHLLSHTGQNQQTTSYTYSDPLGRLTDIQFPDTGETKVSYGDSIGNLYTEIQRKIDSSTWTDEYTLYDGLGRAVSHSRVDPDNGWDRSDTSYDGFGRVAFRSYPCAASTPTGAAVCTAGDSFAYDALGRTLTVTHSDQSQISYSYQGAATEVQDEGNGSYRVTHIYQHDGLGRLVSVCEADGETGAGPNSTPTACSNQIAGFAEDIAATGFETGYSYDALGDLVRVQQPGLEDRTFSDDSLGRLLSAVNPEAGTTRYTWDGDGNLLTRTRPAPNQTDPNVTVTTSYGYDALERLLTVNYSDGATPGLSYAYDQSQNWTQTLTNSIGRRTAAYVDGTGLGSPPVSFVTGRIWSYDARGRVASSSECVPSTCGVGAWTLNYGYDLVGERTGESGGAGATLTASYNRAGRLTGLSSSAGPASLFSGATWFAFGGLHTATRGSGVHETRDYDGRQRLTSLSAQAPLAQYTLNYTLGLSWAPDGALAGAQDGVNGGWSYTYDALNRLAGATCSGTPSAPCAGEANPLALNWSYDRQGNRWAQAVTAGTAPAASASFSGGNNRLDGTSYDAAGNLRGDGTHTYTWDAENRLVAVDRGATARYGYDAAGRRVWRTVNGTTVDDLPGPDGRVRSEYDESRQAWTRTEIAAGGLALGSYNPQTGATTLTIADELGTVRARTDLAGNVQERYTSLPFGDLLATWDDNWQPINPAVGDLSPLHFTGKPRDAETGLDFFGARYYANSLGRFLTPDWSAQTEPVPYAKLDNPQSLNLYTYVLNNPVSIVDPDGHDGDVDVDRKHHRVSVKVDVVLKGSTTKTSAQDFAKAANSVLGGDHSVKVGKQTWKVKVTVKASTNPKDFGKDAHVNTLTVVNAVAPGHRLAEITAPNAGDIVASEITKGGTAAHEAMHLIGLQDEYHSTPGGGFAPNPGAVGSLMGDPFNSQTHLTPTELQQIVNEATGGANP